MFTLNPTKRKFQRFMAAFLVGAVLLTTSAPLPARAGVWGESLASGFLKQALEIIWEQIQALLFGIAKRVAIGIARDQANRLTAGGMDKKPAFITDYRQFIYGVVLDEALLYMDDLISQYTGGKNMELNYIAGGGSVQAIGQKYLALLNNEVKSNFSKENCKYNLDEYSPNPLHSLMKGNWRVANAMVTYPCNNPMGMTRHTRQNVERRISTRNAQQTAEAIAQKGYNSIKDKNGNIISPGSLINDVTSKIQNSATTMLENTGKWGELLAAAAGAFVNQALSNLYQKGFEDVSKKINRELGKVDSKLKAARADLSRELGPGAVFLRNAEQHLNGQGSAGTGKYTGVQQSVVNFNSHQAGVHCGTGIDSC